MKMNVERKKNTLYTFYFSKSCLEKKELENIKLFQQR